MKLKFSKLISELVETWLLWVSNNDKCRDTSLSYSDRRQCVNNCEELIKKEYILVHKLDSFFENE